MDEERKEYWCRTIQECNASGMTVAEWCRGQGIRADLYYKWQSRLIKAGVITSSNHTNRRTWNGAGAEEQNRFVEVSLAGGSGKLPGKDSGITISRNGYCVSVSNDFSDSTLLRVLGVVSHA